MKQYFTLLAVILSVLTPLLPSFADGILNIPVEDGVGQLMPLVGVHVSVEIRNQAAITTVRNTFRVETEDTTATVYNYRLPPTASVTGFGIWWGDSLARFDLRPGQQGGHDTSGFGEQNSDLRNSLGSNPFVIALHTTPPGIFITELRYVQLLSYNFGEVRYDYPLFTGEYLPNDIDTISITGTYESQRAVLEVSGNYDQRLQINAEDDYRGNFTLAMDNTRPGEDLSLTLNYNQEDIGAWIMTHRTDSTRSGYFMLIIDPGIVDTAEAVAKYFTFVIDRSGSMSGSKIVQARQAVLRCLDNLFPRDYFSIIDFDSDVRHFRDEMVAADEENLQSARNYVSRIEPGSSTNIYGALMDAVTQEMDEGAANQIVFTTDGLANVGVSGDRDVIIHDVTEANDFEARIFSFGIGHDVDARFLTALSEVNSGEAIIFDPNEAPVNEIIDDFYTRQSRPALVNPVVEFSEGFESDSLFPPRLQNVAAGNQLYLCGRYSSFGDFDISLSGRMLTGDTTLNFDQLSFPEDEAGNEFVPRLWAVSAINYYLKWIVIHGENQEIIDRIIELSLEFGILTRYTGFVDPNEPPPPPDDTGVVAVREPDLTQFTALPTLSGTELTWTITGVSGVITYNIYKGSSPTGPWVKLNDSPFSERRFTDESGRPNEVTYYRLEAIFDEQSWQSEPLMTGSLPTEITLGESYPNPFNSFTTIPYSLPKASRIRLSVNDISSREIAVLATGTEQAGNHNVIWTADKVGSGLYFVRLEVDNMTITRKVLMVK